MDGPSAPAGLRCEYRENPLGIDEPRPRLSWLVNDPRRGAVQRAYQIQVADSPSGFGRGSAGTWDSGKVVSEKSAQVEYAGAPIESRRRCHWRVRTWDPAGRASPWSAPAWWETALLRAADWEGEFIGLADDRAPAPGPLLRKTFHVSREVRRARAYVTALGFYELRLNGARVGDEIFSPGWTDYRRRIMYQTHDVTGLIRRGTNAVGALLGAGWYGSFLMGAPRFHFGDKPVRFLLQLELSFADGSAGRIVTDGSWKATPGPIVLSELYAGERYDARLEPRGWDTPRYADHGWRPVARYGRPRVEMNAQADPPIRITGELTPVSVTRRGRNRYVFDMGQNMVGVCRLRVRGPRGTTVRLRHAEVLNPDGGIYVANLRSAEATDTYTLAGGGSGTFVPRFTYHGFRYVEVTGFPGEPDPASLTGLVLHTDPPRTSSLRTSSPLVNKLQENIVWGQRGNMHSVLTDCPQRDERLGWMGDAQAFAPTACFNMDMAAVFTKFCRDMRDARSPEGSYADVSPRIPFAPPDGAPAWADAGIIVPWTVHRFYGDERILEREYAAMKGFNDFVARNNPGGLWLNRKGNDYGDWVPAGVETDKKPLGTLIYYNSTRLMEKIARVLGKPGDAALFASRAAHIAGAFLKAHVRGGSIRNGTQTLNAMAVACGILPARLREKAVANLVRDIHARGDHLSTGFLGTPALLPVLTESGHGALARKLILNRDYPSWGYPIVRGATTIWERWNSDTEGPAMNSRNHFAFGSVGEWLFRHLAGIDPDETDPGFGRVLIRPNPGEPGSELDRAAARYDSIRGPVSVAWRNTPGAFHLEVTIPANCRATVVFPARSEKGITEGGIALRRAAGVSRVRSAGGRAACDLGSGTYSFVCRHRPA